MNANARLSVSRFIPWAIGGVVVVCSAAVWWWRQPPSTEVAQPESAVASHAAADTPLVLSAKQAENAGIQTQPASVGAAARVVTVPGKILFDPTRRLVLKSPTDCVVEKVIVLPGDTVKIGQPLVILHSPEVGAARSNLRGATDKMQIILREEQRASNILAGVRELIAALQQGPAAAEVQAKFQDKLLGIHREHLLTAYSKVVAAKLAAQESAGLSEAGGISRRLLQQRESDLQVALASLNAQTETTLFECEQASQQAAADLADAQRAVEIAKGKLQSLIGLLAVEENAAVLNQLVVLSAMEGQIEDRLVVAQQRVSIGDELLVISDSSKLLVSADIHEQEWKAASLSSGAELAVRLPALPGQSHTAKVRFVSATISEESRTLPLLAEIENANKRLRPGMFAWIDLPLDSAPKPVTVVPTSAIMRDGDSTFVFAQTAPNTFSRKLVTLGHQHQSEVEILSGVSAGEQIVCRGAFVLKSELLLEKEE